jgi:hypothetical protein
LPFDALVKQVYVGDLALEDTYLIKVDLT